MDDALELRLLNDFQRDFPLCPAPFAELAARLGVAERVVLGCLEKLRREGRISRVGAVFSPKRIGASTLSAMAVAPARLEAVSLAVSRFPEVNHHYLHGHRYNLWFVVTAASEGRLQATLEAIARAAGAPVLNLPLMEEYHLPPSMRAEGGAVNRHAETEAVHPHAPLAESERRLVSVLQEGLPLFMRPFALVAERIGASESEVMTRIGQWLEAGAIKRFGVVMKHREKDCPASAMLVQDIPDPQVAAVGRALAEEAAVIQCYRRPRLLPDWPYNLFCLIRGCSRAEMEAAIASLRDRHGLGRWAHDILLPRAGGVWMPEGGGRPGATP